MINFREAYHRSEEQTRWLFLLLLGGLFFAVLASVFTSPLISIGVVLGIVFTTLALVRPEWALVFLAVFLPVEPSILQWVPDEIFLPARVFSEAIIYLIFFVALIRHVKREARIPSTPINLPFALFLLVAVASVILNLVPPTNAAFGLRQLFRFILVFFAVFMLNPSKTFMRKLTLIMISLAAVLSFVGLAQVTFDEPLTSFLLPSEDRTFGTFTIYESSVRFWDPHERVFSTLARYDRFATFLAFFLLIGAGLLYEKRLRKERPVLWWLFVLGLPALALTFSRSAWFGLIFGFLFIGLVLKKDQRVGLAVGVASVALLAYIGFSGIAVSQISSEIPNQSFAERFLEVFSYERWRGEYLGLGRLFWIVHTVDSVVPASPLFGHGPGTYGGGASVLFRNTTVFDELGLPYGVYGTDGYIDNNWFSIWGETGTLGLVFYAWMIGVLFMYAIKIARESKDPFTRALAVGFAASVVAVSLNAFLATFFEIRSLAVYFWMYGAFVMLLGTREKII